MDKRTKLTRGQLTIIRMASMGAYGYYPLTADETSRARELVSMGLLLPADMKGVFHVSEAGRGLAWPKTRR